MLSAPPETDAFPFPASLSLALLSSHSDTLMISTTGSFDRPDDVKQWDLLPFPLLESWLLGYTAGIVAGHAQPPVPWPILTAGPAWTLVLLGCFAFLCFLSPDPPLLVTGGCGIYGLLWSLLSSRHPCGSRSP